ncbi:MAG: hypothetical protein EBV19_05705, partial [Flavobacteriia bacterium]|nr:hypothetical protein [Flavobacteriia bacterium]
MATNNRTSSNRAATATRSSISRATGVLPSQKIDWNIQTGYAQTGITAGYKQGFGRSNKQVPKGQQASGMVILESDLGDYNKFSSALGGINKFRQRDAYNAKSQEFDTWLSAANKRAVDAFNSAAVHQTGPLKYASLNVERGLVQNEARIMSRYGGTRYTGPAISSYTPNVDQKFSYGTYGDGRNQKTGIFATTPTYRRAYSDDVPGTAVGVGGPGSRDRRVLAINKENPVDNTLAASTEAVTPGDILRKRLTNLNRRGRISMPTSGGSSE